VTCRDWFQLTLKEGLTVYRDQEFTADMRSRPVQRIEDAITLRSVQFTEDGGPTSHPVRPDSYIKMDNFYTTTVYKKGAEVVRLYRTLLGVDGFRKGARECTGVWCMVQMQGLPDCLAQLPALLLPYRLPDPLAPPPPLSSPQAWTCTSSAMTGRR
jgi:hypothetical protein